MYYISTSRLKHNETENGSGNLQYMLYSNLKTKRKQFIQRLDSEEPENFDYALNWNRKLSREVLVRIMAKHKKSRSFALWGTPRSSTATPLQYNGVQVRPNIRKSERPLPLQFIKMALWNRNLIALANNYNNICVKQESIWMNSLMSCSHRWYEYFQL